MNPSRDKKNINDILLIGGVIIVVIALLIVRNMDRKNAAMVCITDSEGLQSCFSLTEDRIFTVETGLGTNVIEIKDGKVSVSDADCPDKLCAKQGAISKAGESIVCLPHKLVVRITGDEAAESTYDAVTY